MILYHRTSRENAESIAKDGFRDATGTYFTNQEFSGVWVSDLPLDQNEGAWGDVLLEITLNVPESAIADYEWVEEGKPYREWLVPAALINERATLKRVSGHSAIRACHGQSLAQ
jgi:hypothetical protein